MSKKLPDTLKAEIFVKYALGYSARRLAVIYKMDDSYLRKIINREYLGKVKNPGLLTLESKV